MVCEGEHWRSVGEDILGWMDACWVRMGGAEEQLSAGGVAALEVL